MVSHPEPDILECELKWALGSTADSEATGCNGIPVKLFKTVKHIYTESLYNIYKMLNIASFWIGKEGVWKG